MKIVGNLCDRIDTTEGRSEFKSMYDIDPFEYAFNYELFNISRIFPKQYQYLAFLEYDGSARQIFYIEPNEHIMVYNTIAGEIFNTDSMAFFSLIRDSKRIATFCTEHSPYSFDLKDNDSIEEMDITVDLVLENINNFCLDKGFDTLANLNNTLIIRNL